MKGTISKVYHNERSSKITVGGTDYITNAKERKELSVGDVVDFEPGDFKGKPTADKLRKVGREEAPPAPAPSSSTPAPAAAPPRFQKGADNPETAARIARSVALTESIALTSMLLQKDVLPLPKDEKKKTDTVLAFMEERRVEFFNYISGVASSTPADGAAKGAEKVADLGQE